MNFNSKGANMKKKYFFVVCLLLTVIVACFIFFHREKNLEKIVTGKVVEIQDEYILVELENNRSAAIIDKEEVPQNVKVGDFLSITYTGGILDVYPGRIEGIKKIETIIPIISLLSLQC